VVTLVIWEKVTPDAIWAKCGIMARGQIWCM